MRKSFSAKYSASGEGVDPMLPIHKITYAGNVGPLVEYEYVVKHGPKGFGFSVRYVVDKYTNGQSDISLPAGWCIKDVDGSHFALAANFYL